MNLKTYIKISNSKQIMDEIERAEEILQELHEILQGYSGLGKRIEMEIVPAQENETMQAQEKISCYLENQ